MHCFIDWNLIKNVGKVSGLCTICWPSIRLFGNMGFLSDISLPSNKDPTQWCWSPSTGISLLISFHAQWVFFALLKHVCQWTSGMPAALSFPYFTEEGSRSFCWGMRAVHIGQLLCVCFQGHPLVMRDLRTPLELILFCLFSMWIKALFHQCLLYCAFLGDSHTKMPGTSIPGGYHCDDLCCFPCSWSPTLALVTSTWCSAQYKTLLQMYLNGRRR